MTEVTESLRNAIDQADGWLITAGTGTGTGTGTGIGVDSGLPDFRKWIIVK